MSRQSILSVTKIPQRISYKLFVTICISILVGLFMVIMVINSFLAIRSNSLEMSEREAQLTTDHMVSEVEDKLEVLRQYYLYSAMDEDIEWFLNNKLDYSDYGRYKQISTALGNNSLFPNYLNSYVVINYDNGRVISSRGIYELDEMINKEEIDSLYEDNSTKVNKGNWVYIQGGVSADSKTTGYRLTADTKGLNFLLNLPIGVYTSKGFLQVNINMDEWKRWIWDNIDISGRYVAVLDNDGNVIYSNSSEFCAKCMEQNSLEVVKEASKESINNSKYIVAQSSSTMMGWNYYVAYDYGTIMGATSKLLIEFLVAITVLAALSFIAVRYALYQPVDRLIKEVSDDSDTDVKGNELEYLAGQFENLKNDREVLNQSIIQKREKLAELFEMRIIRSAVSMDDEWKEYIKVLNLTEYTYYAVIAIILNLQGSEELEEEINEDALCLELAENLPEDLKKATWLPLIYDSCTLTCIMGADSEEKLMDQISSYYEKVQKYAIGKTGYGIQMGVSEVHTRRNHLGRAYHESVYALTMDGENVDSENAADMNTAGIDISAKNPGRRHVDSEHTDSTRSYRNSKLDSGCRFYLKLVTSRGDGINLKKYEKELCDALKALDKGACYRLIDEFIENIRLVGEWSVASVYLTSVIDAIMIQAIDMQIDIGLICPEGLQPLYHSVLEAGDVSRVRKNLKKYIVDPVFAARYELLEDNSYQMMAQIEKMLADSKGNITLNECADKLGVTPAYIWKIMKAQRGKTFSEYQEEYKIEEAKKLLQLNKSVSDIAIELGYTNAQNFIRFFSKGTGLTPGKYRKLMYGPV